MYRIISILVLAVSTVSAHRECAAQVTDDPIRDITFWMERAENATRKCDGDTRNILVLSVAAAYASSGNVDNCQAWLNERSTSSSSQCPAAMIAAIVSYSGDFKTALAIAAHQETELHRDQCYRNIGRVLAEYHRFDEVRDLLGRIGDLNERSSLLVNIAENLAYSGKWDEAKTAMNQVEPPTCWGMNVDDLVVDEEFVKLLAPIPVDEDPEMGAAIAQARSYLDHFIERLTNPDPSETYFSVRVLVEFGEKSEHLWLNPVRYENDNFIGNVEGTPEKLHKSLQNVEITISKDKASDWQYYNKSKTKFIGNFTSDVENYEEGLAETWKTINECEANQTKEPPKQPSKGVVAGYRKLAGMFTTGITHEDVKSASARASAFADPEKRAAFWLKVAWHEIKAGNQSAARNALKEMDSATSEIAEPIFQAPNHVLAADAYMELGDNDTAKLLLGQAKSSEEQLTLLFRGFASFTSDPLMVGVFVRAGEMDSVFSTICKEKNKDTGGAWMAFGSFCAVYGQLEYIEAHFEDLPTSASKAFVALGVVEGLREAEND